MGFFPGGSGGGCRCNVETVQFNGNINSAVTHLLVCRMYWMHFYNVMVLLIHFCVNTEQNIVSLKTILCAAFVHFA